MTAPGATVGEPAPWEADLTLGEEEARALLLEQRPALAPAHLTLLGEGWDNWAWLVNDALVVRFPRRTIAKDQVITEHEVLSALQGRLPLPVPSPTLLGQPGHGYPFPFVGYPCLPGRTLGEALWGAARTTALTSKQRSAPSPAPSAGSCVRFTPCPPRSSTCLTISLSAVMFRCRSPAREIGSLS